jgi:hypothetical protein
MRPREEMPGEAEVEDTEYVDGRIFSWLAAHACTMFSLATHSKLLSQLSGTCLT